METGDATSRASSSTTTGASRLRSAVKKAGLAHLAPTRPPPLGSLLPLTESVLAVGPGAWGRDSFHRTLQLRGEQIAMEQEVALGEVLGRFGKGGGRGSDGEWGGGDVEVAGRIVEWVGSVGEWEGGSGVDVSRWVGGGGDGEVEGGEKGGDGAGEGVWGLGSGVVGEEWLQEFRKIHFTTEEGVLGVVESIALSQAFACGVGVAWGNGEGEGLVERAKALCGNGLLRSWVLQALDGFCHAAVGSERMGKAPVKHAGLQRMLMHGASALLSWDALASDPIMAVKGGFAAFRTAAVLSAGYGGRLYVQEMASGVVHSAISLLAAIREFKGTWTKPLVFVAIAALHVTATAALRGTTARKKMKEKEKRLEEGGAEERKDEDAVEGGGGSAGGLRSESSTGSLGGVVGGVTWDLQKVCEEMCGSCVEDKVDGDGKAVSLACSLLEATVTGSIDALHDAFARVGSALSGKEGRLTSHVPLSVRGAVLTTLSAIARRAHKVSSPEVAAAASASVSKAYQSLWEEVKTSVTTAASTFERSRPSSDYPDPRLPSPLLSTLAAPASPLARALVTAVRDPQPSLIPIEGNDASFHNPSPSPRHPLPSDLTALGGEDGSEKEDGGGEGGGGAGRSGGRRESPLKRVQKAGRVAAAAAKMNEAGVRRRAAKTGPHLRGRESTPSPSPSPSHSSSSSSSSSSSPTSTTSSSQVVPPLPLLLGLLDAAARGWASRESSIALALAANRWLGPIELGMPSGSIVVTERLGRVAYLVRSEAVVAAALSAAAGLAAAHPYAVATSAASAAWACAGFGKMAADSPVLDSDASADLFFVATTARKLAQGQLKSSKTGKGWDSECAKETGRGATMALLCTPASAAAVVAEAFETRCIDRLKKAITSSSPLPAAPQSAHALPKSVLLAPWGDPCVAQAICELLMERRRAIESKFTTPTEKRWIVRQVASWIAVCARQGGGERKLSGDLEGWAAVSVLSGLFGAAGILSDSLRGRGESVAAGMLPKGLAKSVKNRAEEVVAMIWAASAAPKVGSDEEQQHLRFACAASGALAATQGGAFRRVIWRLKDMLSDRKMRQVVLPDAVALCLRPPKVLKQSPGCARLLLLELMAQEEAAAVVLASSTSSLSSTSSTPSSTTASSLPTTPGPWVTASAAIELEGTESVGENVYCVARMVVHALLRVIEANDVLVSPNANETLAVLVLAPLLARDVRDGWLGAEYALRENSREVLGQAIATVASHGVVLADQAAAAEGALRSDTHRSGDAPLAAAARGLTRGVLFGRSTAVMDYLSSLAPPPATRASHLRNILTSSSSSLPLRVAYACVLLRAAAPWSILRASLIITPPSTEVDSGITIEVCKRIVGAISSLSRWSALWKALYIPQRSSSSKTSSSTTNLHSPSSSSPSPLLPLGRPRGLLARRLMRRRRKKKVGASVVAPVSFSPPDHVRDLIAFTITILEGRCAPFLVPPRSSEHSLAFRIARSAPSPLALSKESPPSSQGCPPEVVAALGLWTEQSGELESGGGRGGGGDVAGGSGSGNGSGSGSTSTSAEAVAERARQLGEDDDAVLVGALWALRVSGVEAIASMMLSVLVSIPEPAVLLEAPWPALRGGVRAGMDDVGNAIRTPPTRGDECPPFALATADRGSVPQVGFGRRRLLAFCSQSIQAAALAERENMVDFRSNMSSKEATWLHLVTFGCPSDANNTSLPTSMPATYPKSTASVPSFSTPHPSLCAQRSCDDGLSYARSLVLDALALAAAGVSSPVNSTSKSPPSPIRTTTTPPPRSVSEVLPVRQDWKTEETKPSISHTSSCTAPSQDSCPDPFARGGGVCTNVAALVVLATAPVVSAPWTAPGLMASAVPELHWASREMQDTWMELSQASIRPAGVLDDEDEHGDMDDEDGMDRLVETDFEDEEEVEGDGGRGGESGAGERGKEGEEGGSGEEKVGDGEEKDSGAVGMVDEGEALQSGAILADFVGAADRSTSTFPDSASARASVRGEVRRWAIGVLQDVRSGAGTLCVARGGVEFAASILGLVSAALLESPRRKPGFDGVIEAPSALAVRACLSVAQAAVGAWMVQARHVIASRRRRRDGGSGGGGGRSGGRRKDIDPILLAELRRFGASISPLDLAAGASAVRAAPLPRPTSPACMAAGPAAWEWSVAAQSVRWPGAALSRLFLSASSIVASPRPWTPPPPETIGSVLTGAERIPRANRPDPYVATLARSVNVVTWAAPLFAACATHGAALIPTGPHSVPILPQEWASEFFGESEAGLRGVHHDNDSTALPTPSSPPSSSSSSPRGKRAGSFDGSMAKGRESKYIGEFVLDEDGGPEHKYKAAPLAFSVSALLFPAPLCSPSWRRETTDRLPILSSKATTLPPSVPSAPKALATELWGVIRRIAARQAAKVKKESEDDGLRKEEEDGEEEDGEEESVMRSDEKPSWDLVSKFGLGWPRLERAMAKGMHDAPALFPAGWAASTPLLRVAIGGAMEVGVSDVYRGLAARRALGLLLLSRPFGAWGSVPQGPLLSCGVAAVRFALPIPLLCRSLKVSPPTLLASIAPTIPTWAETQWDLDSIPRAASATAALVPVVQAMTSMPDIAPDSISLRGCFPDAELIRVLARLAACSPRFRALDLRGARLRALYLPSPLGLLPALRICYTRPAAEAAALNKAAPSRRSMHGRKSQPQRPKTLLPKSPIASPQFPPSTPPQSPLSTSLTKSPAKQHTHGQRFAAARTSTLWRAGGAANLGWPNVPEPILPASAIDSPKLADKIFDSAVRSALLRGLREHEALQTGFKLLLIGPQNHGKSRLTAALRDSQGEMLGDEGDGESGADIGIDTYNIIFDLHPNAEEEEREVEREAERKMSVADARSLSVMRRRSSGKHGPQFLHALHSLLPPIQGSHGHGKKHNSSPELGTCPNAWAARAFTELHATVWDMAGREEYDAALRAFLRGRALYAIVVDVSRPAEERESALLTWSRILQEQAPGAPCILITTHAALCEPDPSSTSTTTSSSSSSSTTTTTTTTTPPPLLTLASGDGRGDGGGKERRSIALQRMREAARRTQQLLISAGQSHTVVQAAITTDLELGWVGLLHPNTDRDSLAALPEAARAARVRHVDLAQWAIERQTRARPRSTGAWRFVWCGDKAPAGPIPDSRNPDQYIKGTKALAAEIGAAAAASVLRVDAGRSLPSQVSSTVPNSSSKTPVPPPGSIEVASCAADLLAGFLDSRRERTASSHTETAAFASTSVTSSTSHPHSASHVDRSVVFTLGDLLDRLCKPDVHDTFVDAAERARRRAWGAQELEMFALLPRVNAFLSRQHGWVGTKAASSALIASAKSRTARGALRQPSAMIMGDGGDGEGGAAAGALAGEESKEDDAGEEDRVPELRPPSRHADTWVHLSRIGEHRLVWFGGVLGSGGHHVQYKPPTWVQPKVVSDSLQAYDLIEQCLERLHRSGRIIFRASHARRPGSFASSSSLIIVAPNAFFSAIYRFVRQDLRTADDDAGEDRLCAGIVPGCEGDGGEERQSFLVMRPLSPVIVLSQVPEIAHLVKDEWKLFQDKSWRSPPWVTAAENAYGSSGVLATPLLLHWWGRYWRMGGTETLAPLPLEFHPQLVHLITDHLELAAPLSTSTAVAQLRARNIRLPAALIAAVEQLEREGVAPILQFLLTPSTQQRTVARAAERDVRAKERKARREELLQRKHKSKRGGHKSSSRRRQADSRRSRTSGTQEEELREEKVKETEASETKDEEVEAVRVVDVGVEMVAAAPPSTTPKGSEGSRALIPTLRSESTLWRNRGLHRSLPPFLLVPSMLEAGSRSAAAMALLSSGMDPEQRAVAQWNAVLDGEPPPAGVWRPLPHPGSRSTKWAAGVMQGLAPPRLSIRRRFLFPGESARVPPGLFGRLIARMLALQSGHVAGQKALLWDPIGTKRWEINVKICGPRRIRITAKWRTIALKPKVFVEPPGEDGYYALDNTPLPDEETDTSSDESDGGDSDGSSSLGSSSSDDDDSDGSDSDEDMTRAEIIASATEVAKGFAMTAAGHVLGFGGGGGGDDPAADAKAKEAEEERLAAEKAEATAAREAEEKKHRDRARRKRRMRRQLEEMGIDSEDEDEEGGDGVEEGKKEDSEAEEGEKKDGRRNGGCCWCGGGGEEGEEEEEMGEEGEKGEMVESNSGREGRSKSLKHMNSMILRAGSSGGGEGKWGVGQGDDQWDIPAADLWLNLKRSSASRLGVVASRPLPTPPEAMLVVSGSLASLSGTAAEMADEGLFLSRDPDAITNSLRRRGAMERPRPPLMVGWGIDANDGAEFTGTARSVRLAATAALEDQRDLEDARRAESEAGKDSGAMSAVLARLNSNSQNGAESGGSGGGEKGKDGGDGGSREEKKDDEEETPEERKARKQKRARRRLRRLRKEARRQPSSKVWRGLHAPGHSGVPPDPKRSTVMKCESVTLGTEVVEVWLRNSEDHERQNAWGSPQPRGNAATTDSRRDCIDVMGWYKGFSSSSNPLAEHILPTEDSPAIQSSRSKKSRKGKRHFRGGHEDDEGEEEDEDVGAGAMGEDEEEDSSSEDEEAGGGAGAGSSEFHPRLGVGLPRGTAPEPLVHAGPPETFFRQWSSAVEAAEEEDAFQQQYPLPSNATSWETLIRAHRWSANRSPPLFALSDAVIRAIREVVYAAASTNNEDDSDEDDMQGEEEAAELLQDTIPLDGEDGEESKTSGEDGKGAAGKEGKDSGGTGDGDEGDDEGDDEEERKDGEGATEVVEAVRRGPQPLRVLELAYLRADEFRTRGERGYKQELGLGRGGLGGVNTEQMDPAGTMAMVVHEESSTSVVAQSGPTSLFPPFGGPAPVFGALFGRNGGGGGAAGGSGGGSAGSGGGRVRGRGGAGAIGGRAPKMGRIATTTRRHGGGDDDGIRSEYAARLRAIEDGAAVGVLAAVGEGGSGGGGGGGSGGETRAPSHHLYVPLAGLDVAGVSWDDETVLGGSRWQLALPPDGGSSRSNIPIDKQLQAVDLQPQGRGIELRFPSTRVRAMLGHQLLPSEWPPARLIPPPPPPSSQRQDTEDGDVAALPVAPIAGAVVAGGIIAGAAMAGAGPLIQCGDIRLCGEEHHGGGGGGEEEESSGPLRGAARCYRQVCPSCVREALQQFRQRILAVVCGFFVIFIAGTLGVAIPGSPFSLDPSGDGNGGGGGGNSSARLLFDPNATQEYFFFQ